MNYNTIGISLNKRCTAQCKICCVSARKYETNELSVELIERYLQDLKNIDVIKMVCFSGGEVFLDYPKLLRLVKYVHGCLKQTSLVTNCFWANTYTFTFNRLKELADNGLDELTISYDRFHGEFIKLSNIKNVLKACHKLCMPVTIQSVMMMHSKNAEWINDLTSYLQDVSIQYVPAYPVGEAEKHFAHECFIRDVGKRGRFCRKNGAFSVENDGTIYPCCSPCIVKTDLKIGSIEDMTLGDTYRKLERNMILYVLRNYGFDFFISAAEDLGIKIPDKLISSCELCAILFNKNHVRRFIPYVKRFCEQ